MGTPRASRACSVRFKIRKPKIFGGRIFWRGGRILLDITLAPTLPCACYKIHIFRRLQIGETPLRLLLFFTTVKVKIQLNSFIKSVARVTGSMTHRQPFGKSKKVPHPALRGKIKSSHFNFLVAEVNFILWK